MRGTGSADAAGELDKLDRRLARWGQQWQGVGEDPAAADVLLVNERLQQAVGRVFGSRAVARMQAASTPQSPWMPMTEPLFTAFLGRRAARELARRAFSGI